MSRRTPRNICSSRARCLRRALQAINQPADLEADVPFGSSTIVAFRLDILLERAKKILMCAGLDQPEPYACQVAYAEAPRKPLTSPILTKTRASLPARISHSAERP